MTDRLEQPAGWYESSRHTFRALVPGLAVSSTPKPFAHTEPATHDQNALHPRY